MTSNIIQYNNLKLKKITEHILNWLFIIKLFYEIYNTSYYILAIVV